MTRSKALEAARKLFLFDGTGDAQLTSYLDSCTENTYTPGQVIHSAQRPLRGIGVIVSGKAKIISGGGSLLRLLKKGDSFGAASVFNSSPSNRTEVICTASCKLLVIGEDVINRVIAEDSYAAVRYITFLSDRIAFLNTRIGSLTAGDTSEKVAGFILSLDPDKSGMVSIGQHLTNVASGLSMSRASLYRTLDRFTELGFIKKEDENVTILDRDSLEGIAYKKKR